MGCVMIRSKIWPVHTWRSMDARCSYGCCLGIQASDQLLCPSWTVPSNNRSLENTISDFRKIAGETVSSIVTKPTRQGEDCFLAGGVSAAPSAQ
ncbi:hypothetical protein BDFG_04307 [Blastomyces dermatitidis ATCC 26199]|nr:hypothetical protein BDFG_04307 [Blastomyces dermatitidis ATCC 26199]